MASYVVDLQIAWAAVTLIAFLVGATLGYVIGEHKMINKWNEETIRRQRH